jgi:hypothetical protein
MWRIISLSALGAFVALSLFHSPHRLLARGDFLTIAWLILACSSLVSPSPPTSCQARGSFRQTTPTIAPAALRCLALHPSSSGAPQAPLMRFFSAALRGPSASARRAPPTPQDPPSSAPARSPWWPSGIAARRPRKPPETLQGGNRRRALAPQSRPSVANVEATLMGRCKRTAAQLTPDELRQPRPARSAAQLGPSATRGAAASPPLIPGAPGPVGAASARPPPRGPTL